MHGTWRQVQNWVLTWWTQFLPYACVHDVRQESVRGRTTGWLRNWNVTASLLDRRVYRAPWKGCLIIQGMGPGTRFRHKARNTQLVRTRFVEKKIRILGTILQLRYLWKNRLIQEHGVIGHDNEEIERSILSRPPGLQLRHESPYVYRPQRPPLLWHDLQVLW